MRNELIFRCTCLQLSDFQSEKYLIRVRQNEVNDESNLLSRSVLTVSIRLSGNEYDEKQRELSREGGGGL